MDQATLMSMIIFTISGMWAFAMSAEHLFISLKMVRSDNNPKMMNELVNEVCDTITPIFTWGIFVAITLFGVHVLLASLFAMAIGYVEYKFIGWVLIGHVKSSELPKIEKVEI